MWTFEVLHLCASLFLQFVLNLLMLHCAVFSLLRLTSSHCGVIHCIASCGNEKQICMICLSGLLRIYLWGFLCSVYMTTLRRCVYFIVNLWQKYGHLSFVQCRDTGFLWLLTSAGLMWCHCLWHLTQHWPSIGWCNLMLNETCPCLGARAKYSLIDEQPNSSSQWVG